MQWQPRGKAKSNQNGTTLETFASSPLGKPGTVTSIPNSFISHQLPANNLVARRNSPAIGAGKQAREKQLENREIRCGVHAKAETDKIETPFSEWGGVGCSSVTVRVLILQAHAHF